MSNRVKNIVVSLSFILVLSSLLLANILLPHRDSSYTERRSFRRPDFSWEKLLSGRMFLEYEKYALEQFALRDQFRGLKALSAFHLLRLREHNDVYVLGDGIYRKEYPLREDSIAAAAAKFREVYSAYLEGQPVYYSVVPDKNYYVAAENGYLALDYGRMQEILREDLPGWSYINLFASLTIDDYYRTDGHWRQERLIPLADSILSQMGREVARGEYARHELSPFYGSYYGRCGLLLAPDNIAYLTNPVLEAARVYDQDGKDLGGIYNFESFSSMDPYNFFLSGPMPILTIENPAAGDDRELVIFRDSFASSLAPLLLEGYARIHLVDLRYFPSDRLGEKIQFGPHQDVLFLYSIPILNNSGMLR
ncbi:MAG: DHHW family protein [Bacillota bacterium]|jgi:hypothetical protein